MLPCSTFNSAPSTSILTISGKTPVVCTTLSIVKVGTMSNFVSEDSVFSSRWPKAQSGVLLKREIEVLSEQAAGIIIAFVILLMRICLARYSIFLIDGSNAKFSHFSRLFETLIM